MRKKIASRVLLKFCLRQGELKVKSILRTLAAHCLSGWATKEATISVKALANDYRLSPLWEQEQQRRFDKIPMLHQCFVDKIFT